MRRLLLDIETAPNVAHVWGMFQQNINPKAVLASGYTLCWSAKWYGQKTIMFRSIHHHGKEQMVRDIWGLLDEADAVIHYNGTRFDVPTLQKEFLQLAMPPPSPFAQIDLLRTVRREFRFHSNKLDDVLKQLGMEGKVQHKGHQLWIECMNGDPKAWAEMRRYNRRDVKIMEDFYTRLLPWIKGHPNFGLFCADNRSVCNKCGSANLIRQGTRRTLTQVYPRYQCNDCGSWLRGRFNETPKRKKDWILTEAG